VAEWLKAHAWKACIRHKRIAGSNPALSVRSNDLTLPTFTASPSLKYCHEPLDSSIERAHVQGVVSQIRRLAAWVRRSLWCAVLGLLALSSPLAAQGDSVPVGPPPHFVAAWAPPGTLIDVSRMDPLQNRVTLNLVNVPIDTAIAVIRERAGLKLLYRVDFLPAGRTVSIQATNITAASALAEVLLDTDLDVIMIDGGHLLLGKCAHVAAGVARRDSGVVAGRVIDRTTGMPLAGAMVTVPGNQPSATANAEGRYRLVGLPAGKHVVTARYIGYAPSSDTVLVGSGGSVQDFTLAPSAHPLEQVVVTGTLVPTEVKALPTPITIITADDIRRQRVMRLDQLFRGQVASALAWDRPGEDHYNIINVRGGSSFSALASVKTFVDGIEIADPTFTTLIDPNSIERIELTRGPQASTMYGSNAISGVLQIFTKKGMFGFKRPEGEIKTSASLIEKNDGPGVAVRLQETATLRGSEQHTRYQASAYYRHDGEWTPSYQNTNWNVTASAENIHGPVTSRIAAIFSRKIFDLPDLTALRDSGYAYFSKPFFNRFDVQTQTYGVNFVYAAKPWWRHDLVLGYDRWAVGITQIERRFTTPDDTLFALAMNHRGKMSIFYFTTVNAALGPAIGATFTAGFNHYSLGGAQTFLPASPTNAGTLGGPITLQRLSSTNSGYFAQAQVNVAETAFLTAGLRAERNPDFGANVGMVVSPRFGTAYIRPIGPVTLKLRASYGEGIRAPDPNQNQPFVDTGFDRLHNPLLQPERQRGSDGGVDLYWGSRASLSVTYYSQEAIDLIDLVYDSTAGDPPRQQSQYQNVANIRNRGWEIEAQYNTKRLQVSGTLSFTHSRILQLDSVYTGNYRPGDRSFDIPRYTAGLTASYLLSSHLSSGMALRAGIVNVGSWVERDWIALYGTLLGGAPSRPSDRDYWITYPGFTKIRIGFERKLWKGIVGTFDVENLTNSQAFEQHNVQVPSPRIFTVALQIPY
jgi:outer membrane receptor protein involved in Fe transport